MCLKWKNLATQPADETDPVIHNETTDNESIKTGKYTKTYKEFTSDQTQFLTVTSISLLVLLPNQAKLTMGLRSNADN